MTPRRLARLLGFLLAAHGLSAVPGSPVLTVSVLQDDNTSRSVREEKSDEAVAATLNLSALRVLNRDWQGNLGVTADATHWRQWDGLDQAARAGLRRKFGFGPYAPRLDLGVTAGGILARTTERSGTTVSAELAFAQRLTPVLSWSAGAALDHISARRAVYSVDGHTFTLRADFDPTPDWRLSAAVRRRSGDIVAWCRASWPEFTGSNPWLDGIFGGDWFPYQVDNPTLGYAFTLSRALGAHTSLELNADLSKTGVSGHVYHVNIFSLQLIHAF